MIVFFLIEEAKNIRYFYRKKQQEIDILIEKNLKIMNVDYFIEETKKW